MTHPVGLDINRVSSALESPKIKEMMERLRTELSGVKLILSVERLDYTKGILEKPTPTSVCWKKPGAAGQSHLGHGLRTGGQRNDHLRRTSCKGKSNKPWAGLTAASRIGWTPLQFFFRSLPFEELAPGTPCRCDVDYPLRDGLNLVAGIRRRSRFARWAWRIGVVGGCRRCRWFLKGALLTNPHDPMDMVQTCYVALNMPKAKPRIACVNCSISSAITISAAGAMSSCGRQRPGRKTSLGLVV